MSFITMSAASAAVIAPLSNAIVQNLTSSTSSNSSRITLQDLTSPPRQLTFPSIVAFRPFEVKDILHKLGAADVSSSPVSLVFTKITNFFQGSQAIAIRTSREVEGDYLSVLSDQMVPGKPLIPVGFLPPPPPLPPPPVAVETTVVSNNNAPQLSAETIFAWLDEQKPKSVVFAGFGSHFVLKTEQILEVAHGLEESEFPFLLVLGNDNIDGGNLLPSGFLDHTASRGRVFTGWAPQWGFLAHPAVGGFLSHGGWGSVIEGLFFGLSIVILPVVNDQPLNAKLLVEKGLATEVDRNEIDGSFTRKDIVKSLKQAMAPTESQGGGAESMRKSCAKEISNIVGDCKLHDLYIDDLVKFMRGKSRR